MIQKTVSVFGLGYVGCVTAACLAQQGHQVIGVDINPDKVDLLNSGHSPVVESGLSELIAETVGRGDLKATTDVEATVEASDLSLICVGTPSQKNGELDLSAVARATEGIGRCLRDKDGYHVLVVRSTVLPGSAEKEIIPRLESASGKRAGSDFGVAINPEFLREGSAIHDFNNPARVVIGELDTRSGDLVMSLYDHLDAPNVRMDLKTAEMVKYVDNAFHAVKVSFANEIGNFCKRHGLDGVRVMEVFTLDTKLNLSPAYLRPGTPFGGSCLPKDLRAVIQRARPCGLEVPLLKAALDSNDLQKQLALEMIIGAEGRQVGVLGLAFKVGTDDLRGSFVVDLIEGLVGRGYTLLAYDCNLLPSKLVGANLAYMQSEVPYLPEILRDSIEDVISGSEVIVIATEDEEFRRVPELVSDEQTVIDLVGIVKTVNNLGENYHGICW